MTKRQSSEIGKEKGLAKIEKGLPAGEFNVVPPFTKKEESSISSGNLIMDRWQYLAGLLKG